MAWTNLSEIDSVSIDDLNEYNSRSDGRVLKIVSARASDDIVIYGATGKWMSDLSEMVLRAIRETGTTRRKVHLVSRFRDDARFDDRFAKYKNLFVKHRIDLLHIRESDLAGVPSDAPWVIYGAGYKFRTTETEEEYTRLCTFYGKIIPAAVFTHHQQGADVVVIGSGNGLAPTPVHNQAKDDAPLVPENRNIYGRSIRDKEEVVKAILEGRGLDGPSRAVILRGMYMTNLTYGGLEKPVLAVMNNNEIDLGELTAFNIIGHRDANIYAILAVQSASNPITTLNLSGHTVDIRDVADAAGKAFGSAVNYKGTPNMFHLLADGSKIERLYGPPVDSLRDLINAQIFWIKGGGYSIGLDHKVGKSI
jgi:hypothetical protein